MMSFLIFFVAFFFSLNMGAPGFAGSFSTAAGSKALNRRQAGVLFLIFALLGAVLCGGEVSKTLGKGIVPTQFLDVHAVFIVLICASLGLLAANLMHIPQSNALSTLAALTGMGMAFHAVHWERILYFIVCWSLSTVASFFLVYGAVRYVYPPRKINFWIYEKLVNHQQRLKILVIATGCYKAFSQGSSNVANAVGPLSATGLIPVPLALLLMGIVYGIGAFVFTGPLQTSSKKIIPLGLLTATVVNFVSGTIIITASKAGIPIPTVIIYTVAIFAVSSVKDGVMLTMVNPAARKTLFTWVVSPVLIFSVSYLLSNLFLRPLR